MKVTIGVLASRTVLKIFYKLFLKYFNTLKKAEDKSTRIKKSREANSSKEVEREFEEVKNGFLSLLLLKTTKMT